MYAFRYSRPHDVADAVARLRADSEAKLLAGGMTLIPSMKYRLAAPTALLDIGRLAQLQGIAEVDGRLAIGAGVRHVDVADDRIVQERIPELAVLAGTIGDPQVRNRGTLGGSLANNDPAADYPAAALALAARVETDRRTLAADDFFVDLFTTALEPDEIVVRVSFAIPKRAGYAKFRHPASGYAMAGVFVAELDDGIRVAVTGAGPCVFRHRAAEQALERAFSATAVADIDCPADGLNADFHAPAAYRAQLVKVMTAEAVGRALGAVTERNVEPDASSRGGIR
jgi:carbon-monoxide dehydrogenase medium subunit